MVFHRRPGWTSRLTASLICLESPLTSMRIYRSNERGRERDNGRGKKFPAFYFLHQLDRISETLNWSWALWNIRKVPLVIIFQFPMKNKMAAIHVVKWWRMKNYFRIAKVFCENNFLSPFLNDSIVRQSLIICRRLNYRNHRIRETWK